MLLKEREDSKILSPIIVVAMRATMAFDFDIKNNKGERCPGDAGRAGQQCRFTVKSPGQRSSTSLAAGKVQGLSRKAESNQSKVIYQQGSGRSEKQS